MLLLANKHTNNFSVICYLLGTTTTSFYCGQSCLNQSWFNSTGDLAYWPFDGTYDDVISSYNPVSFANLPTFVSGYVGEAVLFNASAKQAIFTSFIPLYNRSFTIEAWIKPTGYPNSKDHTIFGLCKTSTTNYCLHLMIRYEKLYLGLLANDASGTTNITLNQWSHIAFIYDFSTKTESVYLNGFKDGQKNPADPFLATDGNVTIGMHERISVPGNNYQVRFKTEHNM